MTTIMRSFEAPHWHTSIACDCDDMQVCDICDTTVCITHQGEEVLTECRGLRGIWHHDDCTGGCADCYTAEADSYYSSVAESRHEDRLAAAAERGI